MTEPITIRIENAIIDELEIIHDQLGQISDLTALYRHIERRSWMHHGDLEHVSSQLAKILDFLQGDDR